MPAALRSVAGPRALLPPLSPHLGPIVGLGAPGGDGGKDAERKGEKKRLGRRRESARKDGEGSPALRPVRGVRPAKLSQFERRLPRPTSPNSPVRGEQSERAPKEGGEKPEQRKAGVREATARFPPQHRSGCRSGGCLGNLPGPGLSRV